MSVNAASDADEQCEKALKWVLIHSFMVNLILSS